MDDENFEAPPTILVIGTVIAGVLSGIGLIILLEYLSKKIPPQPSSTSNHRVISMVIPWSDYSSSSFFSQPQSKCD